MRCLVALAASMASARSAWFQRWAYLRLSLSSCDPSTRGGPPVLRLPPLHAASPVRVASLETLPVAAAVWARWWVPLPTVLRASLISKKMLLKSPWQFRRKRSVVFVTELQITRLSVATSCFRCCCGVFSPHTLIQRKNTNDAWKQPIQHTKPVFVVPVPSTRVRSQAACTTTETTTTISTSTTKEEQG